MRMSIRGKRKEPVLTCRSSYPQEKVSCVSLSSVPEVRLSRARSRFLNRSFVVSVNAERVRYAERDEQS